MNVIPALAIAGVLLGLLAYFHLGMHFGMVGESILLMEYPLTRRYGLTIPVVELVLLAQPRIRARFGGLLVGGPLVYAGAAVTIAIGLVCTAIDSATGSLRAPILMASVGVSCAVPFGVVAVRAWLESSRSMRDYLIGAFSIALMLILPAADWLSKEGDFSGRLRRAASEASFGSSLDLRAIQPGPWERLLVFGWYSAGEEVDRALGYRWNDKRRTSVAGSEAHHLFLFVDSANEVLSAYEIPRDVIDFCPKLHYLGLERDDAVISVDNSGWGPKCLRQPAQ